MNHNRIKGLYCIIDSSWVALTDAGDCARELVEAGVGIIQLRAKDEGSANVLKAAREVREATRSKALFIVNDRIDIAILSDADGVHLGQGDISLSQARKLMPSAMIGISTHNLEEAMLAEKEGADYISLGPVFQTKTKKDADSPKGLESIRALAPKVNIPIVAIGGISADTAAPVIQAGASSVAIISDILLSGDVRNRAAEIIASIRPIMEKKSRYHGSKR